jgi:2-methylisocitrate lyase-like PEP mutase family enzyme
MVEVGRRSPGANVANMIEGGRTPMLTKAELAKLDFHLVLHPLVGLFAAAKVIQEMYRKLKADGTIAGSQNQQMSFAEFNELIGVEGKYELARQFGVE